jgi:hypothetical protein
MAKIYGYRKVTDEFTTHSLQEPDSVAAGNEGRITELCTIDGMTYVSAPDTVILPEQPEEISVKEITLTDVLTESIKAASPHVALVNERVVEKIRTKYTVDDEFKMLRMGPSHETDAYNDHVETCRAWGRSEKERLGLAPNPRQEAWLTSAKNPDIIITDKVPIFIEPVDEKVIVK